jgi:hypothetical protein
VDWTHWILIAVALLAVCAVFVVRADGRLWHELYVYEKDRHAYWTNQFYDVSKQLRAVLTAQTQPKPVPPPAKKKARGK